MNDQGGAPDVSEKKLLGTWRVTNSGILKETLCLSTNLGWVVKNLLVIPKRPRERLGASDGH